MVEIGRARKQATENLTRIKHLEQLIDQFVNSSHPAPIIHTGTEEYQSAFVPQHQAMNVPTIALGDCAAEASPIAANVEVDDTQALEYLTLNRKQDFSLHQVPLSSEVQFLD